MNRKIVGVIKNIPFKSKEDKVLLVMPTHLDLESGEAFEVKDGTNHYLDIKTFLKRLIASDIDMLLLLYGDVSTEDEILKRVLDQKEEITRMNVRVLYEKAEHPYRELLGIFAKEDFSMEKALCFGDFSEGERLFEELELKFYKLKAENKRKSLEFYICYLENQIFQQFYRIGA